MDPDDYFEDDDLILDENVLAVLDAEENKFKQAQQQQQPVGERRPADAPPAEPPPSKRQKTSHEWNEEQKILLSPEDDEGLPDISIMGGGAYRVPAAQWAAANALAAQLRGPQAGAGDEKSGGPVRSAAHTSTSRAPGAPVASTSTTAANRVGVSPQPLVPALAPASIAVSVVPGPISAFANSPRQSTTTGPSIQPHSTNRLRRASTLGSVQAALAGFVPPPTAGTKPTRPTPSAAPPRASRPSAPPHRSASPSVAPSQSRPSGFISAQAPHVSRTSVLPQPTTGPSYRRQSVPNTTRPVVQSPSVQPRPPQPLPPSQGQSERSIRLEVDALRAQVEDLLRAQEETNKALREARSVQYAKEGEVSILRKNMEKTAKEHAAEFARMKAAKEQAEAYHAQLRKEIAEERERLRTQFIFKQHELETSLRKSPWASRISRTFNQGPPSPVFSASQKRLFAANGQAIASTSVLQTPSRRRTGFFVPESPGTNHARRLVDNQATEDPPPAKPARLPGFHNAFEPSPLKSTLQFSQLSQSTQVKDKGKGQARAEPFYDFRNPTPEDVFFNPAPPIDDAPGRMSPASSSPEQMVEALAPGEPTQKQQPPQPEDVAGRAGSPGADGAEMKVDDPPSREPAEPLQVPDWTKELHRIVLTHRHRDHKQPTLQILMNYMIPPNSPEHSQQYSSLSASLLETLGTATLKVANTDDVIHSVQQTLSAMGRILCSIGSIVPLAALLDLMKTITLFIPAFVCLALAPTDEPGGSEAPPDILLLLCEAVRSHLTPSNGTLDESRRALAIEVLAMLETICWYTPPDLAARFGRFTLPNRCPADERSGRLSVFVLKAGVLSTLVNSSQPTWLLQRTMRALTLLASYHSLWKHFLSFPLPDAPSNNDDFLAKDFTRIPHIEQLASLLIDPARDGPECRPLREAVLNFVGTLAVAHPDALAILLRSHTLLPSIVAFLNNITAPLWEEDERFVRDADLINWTVEVTARTLMLLHHLQMNADGSMINFRQKLMFAPRRFSNALWHMFTVTLGRISYAYPPAWVGMENAVCLDHICDVAREVLDVATDGPELEWIWNAFHIPECKTDEPTQNQEDEDEEDEGEVPRGTSHSVIVID
ncbi:hypothetical protein C8Q73DRAFT_790022 [Cubamyces lactineus]|nr:hypothetical protein C8Q73DRAFT_790022 [Cubamyces lactineus]